MKQHFKKHLISFENCLTNISLDFNILLFFNVPENAKLNAFKNESHIAKENAMYAKITI